MISAKIFVPRCSSCHGRTQPFAGQLDLFSPGVRARLLNVAAPGCMGKTFAVDTPAVGGHLFDKLAGPVPGCGPRMPFGGTPLTPEEIQCLEDWIKPPL